MDEDEKKVIQLLSVFFPHLSQFTLFVLECQSLWAQQEALKTPTSPALSDALTLFSQLSTASGATVVAPHLISEIERVHYWNGISMDPPELLYRSDLELNPFPVPPPGTTRWSELPVKTAEGVFGTPLDVVWHIVPPMIVALFKKHGIKYSALKTACFSTRDQDGKKTLQITIGPRVTPSLGPIVIWIATHSNTSAENTRDASPDILHILKEHKSVWG